MRALDDRVCTSCHQKFATTAALTAHTHHLATGEGSRCMNCHMPRKNMNLVNELGRYHRIGSPNAKVKVENDRPLECTLCHADRSVESLVQNMEAWWGQHYDRGALVRLYGDLAQSGLRATLRNGKPHEQAVALYLAGARADKTLADDVAAQLTNALPIVRFYAAAALAKIIGAPPAGFDVQHDDATIATDAARWLGHAVRTSSSALAPDGAED